MSWKTFLFGNPEHRNQSPQPTPVDNSLTSGQAFEWLNITSLGALNISTFNRGVNLIAGAVSQLPIYTKKISGKGQTNILRNHPTMMLWNDQNNFVDKVTFIRCIVENVICKGNSYAYIYRAADGTPIGLRYLESNDVTVNYQKEKKQLTYQCALIKGGQIPYKDMLHFKLFTWDGVKGISVLAHAKHEIDLANTTNEHSKKFFEKGGNNVTGVLTVGAGLQKKQREEIIGEWKKTFTNAEAGIAVLQGNMTYQPISSNPDDCQLLESREFNQADVCQFLNINPAQLGLKGFSPYKSFEDANNELLQRTLMPYISMIEAELSRKLLKENEIKNVKIILDTAAFLRPNKQSEAQYYGTLIDKGVLTRNEVREILGYNRSDNEGMDDFIVPFTDINQNTINKDNNEENTDENDGEGDKEL